MIAVVEIYFSQPARRDPFPAGRDARGEGADNTVVIVLLGMQPGAKVSAIFFAPVSGR